MKTYSMRSSLLITILAMGLLSVAFTLFTGEIYLQQTIDDRRQAFVELVELSVHNLLSDLKDETQSLGVSIQSSKVLKESLPNTDINAIEAELDEHFNRAYVTLGVLDLKKIIIYDKQLNKVTQSSKGDVVANTICPAILINAKKRKGTDRFKVLHQVCVFDGEVRMVTMLPIGGLRLNGYIMVSVDPIFSLSKSEKILGVPVLITTINEKVLFKSARWPGENEMRNIMLAIYPHKAGNKYPVAYFSFAFDVEELKSKLSKLKISLVSIVAVTTLFAVYIALTLFRRTIINPLEKMNAYLEKIRSDKKYLKEKFSVEGSKELVVLASKMDSLSYELNRVYGELEKKAFTDALTGIPNRALLFDRLAQITLQAKREKDKSGFMLMMMDLNRFKSVNDELGHYIGDELLKAVADRLKLALRVSDTVARIGGDEFAVVLYAINNKDLVVSVAEKITALMAEHFIIEGHDIDVGMSIGITRFPDDGESGAELMHCADMAMYYSKRNQLPYVFYEKELMGN